MFEHNIELNLRYNLLNEHLEHEPSRLVDVQDTMLGSETCILKTVKHLYGPHTAGLMASDSNGILDKLGQ